MIYIFILFLLLFNAVCFDVMNVRGGRLIAYIGSYLVLVCLAGFRYYVGGDTYNYMYTWDFLPSLSELFFVDVDIKKLQPLWLLFSSVSKTISDEFYVFQLFHALFVNGIILYFIWNNVTYRHTGLLFYFFALYPQLNFEILREALAICMFLIAVRFYVLRSWLPYYILITAAFLFHYSAIFLYFLPFIRNIEFKFPRLLAVFVLAWFFNELMPTVLGLLGASGLFGLIEQNYTTYTYTYFGLLSIFLIYLTVPAFLTWSSRYRFNISTGFDLMLNKGLIVAAAIPLLFIFFRFFNYFSLFYILIASEVFHALFRSRLLLRVRTFAAPVVFICFIAFYTSRYFSDTSELVEGTRWYSYWHPYYSIFDQKLDSDREALVEAMRYNISGANR